MEGKRRTDVKKIGYKWEGINDKENTGLNYDCKTALKA